MRSPLGSRPAVPEGEWKIALCFLILLISLGVVTIRVPLRAAAVATVSPIWELGRAIERVGGTVFSGFLDTARLKEENDGLRREIAALRAEYWRSEAVEEERDALRAYLGRASTTDHAILAYVLAAPNRAPYDTLLLDVGEDAGIFSGARIFTDGGFAIGVVRDVFPSRSVAELYSSPGLSQEVVIGSSRIPATAHGIGAGNYRIELPKNTDIAEGDSVVFAGTTEEFLGVVERILVDEKTGITTLFLRLPVNMNELRSVIVDIAPAFEPFAP